MVPRSLGQLMELGGCLVVRFFMEIEARFNKRTVSWIRGQFTVLQGCSPLRLSTMRAMLRFLRATRSIFRLGCSVLRSR